MSNLRIPSFLQSMHITSRLFVGATFLLSAVLNHLVTIALIQLFLFILILMSYQDGSRRVLRALLLLRWLVVPIVLLHALFTPGALIVSGMTWPVSVEGIQSGIWFSLHLVSIFFAAMLFSLLLTQNEWIATSLKVPLIGHRILPYAMLMELNWSRIHMMLINEYSNWQQDQRGVRHLIYRLSGLPSEALKVSHEIANEVWNNWDQSVNGIVTKNPAYAVSTIATLLALFSALMMWFVTIYGGF